MEYIHIRSLEKYHPGYKDRTLQWAKIHFQMVQGDPDCELISNEIDWGRLIKIILLELQAKKPLPNIDTYWAKKGFDLKKRPMSKTLQMLHNFISIDTEDSKLLYVDKDKEVDKEVDKKPTNHSSKKDSKTKYADYVSMTETEYNTLNKDYGRTMATTMIVSLSNYKAAHGKQYKSDYRAILSWVVDKCKARKIYTDAAQVKTETPTQRVNNQPKLRRHEPRDPEQTKKVQELIDRVNK